MKATQSILLFEKQAGNQTGETGVAKSRRSIQANHNAERSQLGLTPLVLSRLDFGLGAAPPALPSVLIFCISCVANNLGVSLDSVLLRAQRSYLSFTLTSTVSLDAVTLVLSSPECSAPFIR